MGKADASSANDRPMKTVKTATSGQPNSITRGPPAVSPAPYSVTAPVRTEMIEKLSAKF